MKLCLIGSTRFMPQYIEANRKLTLDGHIVYTVATMSTSSPDELDKQVIRITEEEKIILDLVHLQKIDESHGVVLVTDESRYIGFSTRRELQWAQMRGKIIYLRPEDVPSPFYEVFNQPEGAMLGQALGFPSRRLR